ncbi:MAG: CBS domain-containing protein [Methanobacteriaceae archaeon]|jgi:CBS domain-containing protein|nr:CBS domain-containing protein [Methanobacteriaceae archaeon]
MYIKNIMTPEVVLVDKDQNICDALKLMKKNKISRLIVVNTNEEHVKELVGVITEKDIALKLGSSKYGNLAPSHFHVSTVMHTDLVNAESDQNVGTVAKKMLDNRVGGLPVLDKDQIEGVVTKTDFIGICMGKPYQNTLVKDIMSQDLITIAPHDRIVHARRLILDEDLGRLPVMEDGELVGMITAKDIAKSMISFRKVVPDKYKAARIRNLLVEDVMTQNVETINENLNVEETAKTMVEEGFSGMPVVDDDGQLVGIITKTDLVKFIAEMEGVR